MSCGATSSSKPTLYVLHSQETGVSAAGTAWGAHSQHTHCRPAAGTFAPSSTESDVEQGGEEPPAKQTVMLDVSGMMCGGCSAAVKNILLKQPGVQGAAVNLITHAAAVTVR
jgi:Cu2+-exporting ATPase